MKSCAKLRFTVDPSVVPVAYICVMSKNVLITGSTSGIGLGIAREFARAGFNISFNGLEKNGAEIAANAVQSQRLPMFGKPVPESQSSTIKLWSLLNLDYGLPMKFFCRSY